MSERGGEEPFRILIVLLGALGDVVRGLGVVRAIRRSRPGAKITWLVEPASAGIVSLHDGIDEILVFQRKQGMAGIRKIWGDLRGRQFDLTLDMQRHLKSGFFSWLSGAPRRIGFHPKDAKEGNWVFNTEYIARRGDNASKVDHYLSFLEPMGCEIPPQVDFGLSHVTLSSHGREWAHELSEPYIGIVLGSSRYSKDWPEEGYRALLEKGDVAGLSTAVLLGDPSKGEMAERLASVRSPLRIVNTVGRTDLSALVAIIHGAKACVGPDSGPAHIAGALGVPHVTLFGPTPSGRNAPRGSESLAVVSQLGCVPCRRRTCPGLDKLCMRLISPDQVLERVRLAVATPFCGR